MLAIRIFLKTICFLALILVFAKSWQSITDGFRIDKIKTTLGNNKAEKKNISNDINDIDLNDILDQQFRYLSKGCQTYVFESEDKNYVIKFIRYHRYGIPLWLNISGFTQDYKNIRLSYKSRLLNDSLNSYQIANEHLKNETATMYVHLHKTRYLNKKLKIIDRLNREYLVDLDTTGFVIQKKVKTFAEVLRQNINNEKELKKLTNSFLQTTKAIYEKGFINDDYNCVKNSGVIGERVIHTDLGSFLKKDNLDEKETFEKEFYRFVKYFKKWADKNAPFLITYVDDEIKKMTSTQ